MKKLLLLMVTVFFVSAAYAITDTEEEMEREADNNYYNSICQACADPQQTKIKQNIAEGGDASWWKYMCTDFCKNWRK